MAARRSESRRTGTDAEIGTTGTGERRKKPPLTPGEARERRSERRLPVIPPDTDARILQPVGWTPIRAMIVDLSAGGLQAVADEPLAIGDSLDFGFSLADEGGAKARVRADVLRVERLPGRVVLWRAGCALPDIDPTTRAQLDQFVTQQDATTADADLATESDG